MMNESQYRDLTDSIKPKRGRKPHPRKVALDYVAVRKLEDLGISRTKLAERYGVNLSRITELLGKKFGEGRQ